MQRESESPTPYHGLYFHGLGTTQLTLIDRIFFSHLRHRGIELEHALVDWHGDQSFQELFDHATEQAEQRLRTYGQLTLVGASAGGSMAVNVFHRLRSGDPDLNISVISLSGRLHIGDPQHLERRALHRLGKPSPAFIGSVTHCHEVAIPGLTEADKQLVGVARPWIERTVPLATMSIEDAHEYTVPAIGHVAGIGLGALWLPRILDDMALPT
ncbi:MAG TPA: hypothetical protein VK694_00150 [Verrucomicrobiae bacterium]|nr:hypothetical protein [Verrucomicrobiae bacterium]